MKCRSLRGILAVGVLLSCVALAAASPELSESFTSDPAAAGWTPHSPSSTQSWLFGPYTGPAWWTGGNGYVTAATNSQMIESPSFAVTPDQYYRIEYSSRVTGNGGMITLSCRNPNATYGLWEKPPSWYGEPDELTGVTTQITASSGWTTHVQYIRARTNAVSAYVQFQAKNSSESGNLSIDNVTVQKASAGDVAAWANSLCAQMPQIHYTPPVNHLTGLDRTMAKLRAGQSVTIVMLGDSIMDDTANSTIDVLLQQRYGSLVKVVSAVGSGTSIKEWNKPANTDPSAKYLNLQANVYDQAPDLVMMGGISNRTEAGSMPCYQDFRDVIDKIRAGVQNEWGYTVDIMLMTGAVSDYGDAAGYAAGLQSIATEKGAAFMDIRAAWNAYLVDAASQGFNKTFFQRDGSVHANDYGKEVVGQLLYDYMTPEPASILLLATGGLALLRRRHRPQA